jgi:hypothetical protein
VVAVVELLPQVEVQEVFVLERVKLLIQEPSIQLRLEQEEQLEQDILVQVILVEQRQQEVMVQMLLSVALFL